MRTIESVFNSGHNILFVDNERKMYITGDNNFRKTGATINEAPITNPIELKLELDANEHIIKFKSYLRSIYIYTNQCLVILYSRNTHKYNPNDLPLEIPDKLSSDVVDEDSEDLANLQGLKPQDLIKLPFSNSTNAELSPVIEERAYSIRDSSRIYVPRFSSSYRPSHDNIVFSISPTRNRSTSDEMTAPPSNELRIWRPLSQAQFEALDANAKSLYIQCATHRVASDVGRSSSWAADTEILSVVLAQIDAASNPLHTHTLQSERVLGEEDVSSDEETEPSRILTFINECLYVDDITASTLQSSHTSYRNFPNCKPIIMTGILNIVFGNGALLYLMQNRIVIESINQHPKLYKTDKLYYHAKLGFKTYENLPNCFEICFPFKVKFDDETQCMANLHFLLIKVKIETFSIYHIIVPHPTEASPAIWLYFESDLDLNIQNIHWCDREYTVYVEHEDAIYRYLHSTHILEKFLSNNISYIFVNREFGQEFCVVHPEGLSVGTKLCSLREYNDFMHWMTNIFLIPKQNSNTLPKINHMSNDWVVIILHEKPLKSQERVLEKNSVICVNISGLKHWGCDYQRMFAYVEGDYLYVIAKSGLLNTTNRAELINSYPNIGVDYFRFRLPVHESEIVEMTISSAIVFLTENDTFFAYVFEKFVFRKADINSNILATIPNAHLVNRSRVSSSRNASLNSNATVKIQVTGLYVEKLMYMTEMFEVDTSVNVGYYEGTNQISVGNGVRREFFELGIKTFADIHFIQHNFLSEFNLDILCDCTICDLYLIGKMLVFVINNLSNHLPIRLPLLLVSAIRRRQPTVKALEFFANQEDSQAFAKLKAMEKSPDQLHEAGFESYHHGLKFLCKYDNFSEDLITQAYAVAYHIANGFLAHTSLQEIGTLNMATLDYYLSGDFTIDSERILCRVNFSGDTTEHNGKITNIIRELSQQDLRTLLINWTGTSVFNYNNDCLTISVSTSQVEIVKFGTCSKHMYISSKMFSDFEPEQWTIFLTSACSVMRN